MTTPPTSSTADESVVRLSSPRDVLDSIPHALGFRPSDCLVVVLMRASAGLRRRSVLTLRCDLIGPVLPSADAVDWNSIRSAVRNSGATSSLMAVFATGDPEALHDLWQRAVDDGIEGPGAGVDRETARAYRAWMKTGCVLEEQRELMLGMGTALEKSHAPLTDVLVVSDGRYFSLMCEDDGCCPAIGVPYDVDSPGPASTTLAVEGSSSPLVDRSALKARFRHDANACAQVRDALSALTEAAQRAESTSKTDGSSVSVAVEGILQCARRWRAGEICDHEGAAEVLLSLHDVHVRDAVLARLFESRDGNVHDADDMHAADELGNDEVAVREYLTWLVRCAPDDVLAAPATMVAILWWVRGDGASANIALDRALVVSPDYRLARMTEQIMRAAVPPTEVRALLSQAA